MSPNCLACRLPGCNRRLIHFRRIPGTERWTIITDEEVPTMTRGVKTVVDVNPETGRRQLFSIAVKYGLTEQDVQGVCDQIKAMTGLVDEWHKQEEKTFASFLTHRDGKTLVEMAEEASALAWSTIAFDFERQFPGYKATLERGQVRVREA